MSIASTDVSTRSYWAVMRFKGNRVWVRANADGVPIVGKGLVDVRYKADAEKVYRGSAKSLEPLEAPEPVLEWVETTAVKPKSPPKGRNTRPAEGSGATVPAPRKGAVVIYADGACTGNPGPAGSGVVIVDGGTCEEHSIYLGQATNNVGELTAILRGLERMSDPTRPVDLYTDSDYAIGVLTRGWKAKANTELIMAIRAAMVPLTALNIHWVPGHAGIPLNERADELARLAIRKRASTVEVVPLSS